MISSYKSGDIIKARTKLALYNKEGNGLFNNKTTFIKKDEIALVLKNHDNLLLEILYENNRFFYSDYYPNYFCFPFSVVKC